MTLLVVLVIVACMPRASDGLLHDTQLSSPSTPSLCPLVPSCICKWSGGKQGALCERRNLQSIPSQLPQDTQVLDMNGNNLGQLQQFIFQDRRLTNLQKVFLSECKISSIADEAFAHLTNLIELDLSHNSIQQIPTKSLEPLRNSLRKLTLAHNPIHVIDSGSFKPLNHLNLLDLSSCQISQLKPNAFQGLTELRDLKLNENRLSQLPTNVIGDLAREFLILDLFGNPWHCDCELRQSIDWMNKHHVQLSISPTCATPAKHKDLRWTNVKLEEFMCPPVMVNKQNELVVGAGSNVTLACTARGSPPLNFIWFQDEKNLTGRNASNQSEPAPSTKLLEEKRYEIAEEQESPTVTTSILYLMNLKLTDTSLFLCWVENGAGYTLGNFSLVVDDSPPARLGTAAGGPLGSFGHTLARVLGLDSNDSTAVQLTFVLIGFLLVLGAGFVCLLMFRQIPSTRSSKSSTSDLKSHQINGKLSNSSKFGQTNGNTEGRMFASSDEDGVTDDDDEVDDDGRSSTVASSSSAGYGSQSSCRKQTPKVLAVNDLDGFIEHMRSGIINMDYHSMSPVIQFNNVPPKTASNQIDGHHHHQHQQQQQHPGQQLQHLTHLNHFPSASNASSQVPYYGGQPSNGSNSMATTLSDLSPSSGSASTNFASSNNVIIPPHNQQQHQQFTAAQQQMSRQQPASLTNCDFPTHQLGSQQDMAAHSHLHHHHHQALHYGDEQSMTGEQQMMPLMYNYDVNYQPQLYNHTATSQQHQQQHQQQQLHPSLQIL